eukprot:14588668-Alexandrium_andersonii.AAC.2
MGHGQGGPPAQGPPWLAHPRPTKSGGGGLEHQDPRGRSSDLYRAISQTGRPQQRTSCARATGWELPRTRSEFESKSESERSEPKRERE